MTLLKDKARTASATAGPDGEHRDTIEEKLREIRYYVALGTQPSSPFLISKTISGVA